jgi:hypothetical protein
MIYCGYDAGIEYNGEEDDGCLSGWGGRYKINFSR